MRSPLWRYAPIFESGVLERLIVDAGGFTIAAYLQTLEMREAPRCARP